MARGGARRPTRSPLESASDQVTVLKTPRQRMRKTFRILREVIDSATSAALALRYDRADASVVQLEVAVFGRGLNALKAVRVLCENAHWEFATPAVRQLFELALSMEQVDGPNRRQALAAYQSFGLLQLLRAEVGHLEYDQKTGRAFDAERLASGRALLDSSIFDEFRTQQKGGGTGWVRSWARKSTREMADASPHTIRVDQYRHLFSSWSEQTHGTPSAILQSFMFGGAVADVVARDEVRIAETVGSAVTHLGAVVTPITAAGARR